MKRDIIAKGIESARIKTEFFEKNVDLIDTAIKTVTSSFKSEGKLLIAGNGGSAADAQHIAAEFVNRFFLERKPLPAIALTTDSSILTSIGNDYSFDEIFSKQIEALGKNGDIFLAISTSGNSKNVIKAAFTASNIGIKTIGLTGNDGGQLAKMVDININVASNVTARIQEVHITFAHILCEFVERELFKEKDEI